MARQSGKQHPLRRRRVWITRTFPTQGIAIRSLYAAGDTSANLSTYHKAAQRKHRQYGTDQHYCQMPLFARARCKTTEIITVQALGYASLNDLKQRRGTGIVTEADSTQPSRLSTSIISRSRAESRRLKCSASLDKSRVDSSSISNK